MYLFNVGLHNAFILRCDANFSGTIKTIDQELHLHWNHIGGSAARPSWSSPVPCLEGSIPGYCHFLLWGGHLRCVSECGCTAYISAEITPDLGPKGLLPSVPVHVSWTTVAWSHFHFNTMKAWDYFASGEGCGMQMVYSTGVDCFGPFIMKVGCRTEKRRGLTYKC